MNDKLYIPVHMQDEELPIAAITSKAGGNPTFYFDNDSSMECYEEAILGSHVKKHYKAMAPTSEIELIKTLEDLD